MGTAGYRLRLRRLRAAILVALLVLVAQFVTARYQAREQIPVQLTTDVLSNTTQNAPRALEALGSLEVKGRAPKTGYARSEFGDGWAEVAGCDMRNIMLKRGMSDVELSEDGCVVLRGTLQDVYTDSTILFVRGSTTSDAVQIDHVVALSDAWQKGAQQLTSTERTQFANDPLNLLAVDGPANQQKADSDAASWLPPNKNFRCAYIARQIAVKQKYRLWVTEAEKAVMTRVLNGCSEQTLPVELLL